MKRLDDTILDVVSFWVTLEAEAAQGGRGLAVNSEACCGS